MKVWRKGYDTSLISSVMKTHKCIGFLGNDTWKTPFVRNYMSKGNHPNLLGVNPCLTQFLPKVIAPEHPNPINVIFKSWNILSFTLTTFEPDEHHKCTDWGINEYHGSGHHPIRTEMIFKELEMDLMGEKLICLQEADHKFRTDVRLHALLETYQYGMVVTCYGELFNKPTKTLAHGFLGNGILYPTSIFELLNWEPVHTVLANFDDPNEDPLLKKLERSFADRKIMCARFRHIKFGTVFCVACMHIPCQWQDSDKMHLMIQKSIKAATIFAEGDPLIVAGDFNLDYYRDNFHPTMLDELKSSGDFDFYQPSTETSETLKTYESITAQGFEDPFAHLRTPGHLSCIAVGKHNKQDMSGNLIPRPLALDYIFIKDSKNVFSFEGYDMPRIDDESMIYADCFPNAVWPSDHFPLSGMITFKRVEDDPEVDQYKVERLTATLFNLGVQKMPKKSGRKAGRTSKPIL